MNAFVEHHKNSIQFGYRCFDRLLLNGLIQPFQQPERVLGFFNTYRDGKRVTRRSLTDIADQFQYWLKSRTEKWGIPLLDAPEGNDDESRRNKFLEPYFQDAKPNQVVAVLKAREPARILVAIGDKNNDSPHLEYKQRWVNQYNFYVNDPHWGRMFVRMSPYFPFSARVCLNQHHWLAIRMREEGIDFQQCTNAFLKCSQPARLQELANSLTARDLLKCGQKWLAAFTPFITDKERKHAGCQHRLFFSQVEYCDNQIFHRRAAVDELTERLDQNRMIGQHLEAQPEANETACDPLPSDLFPPQDSVPRSHWRRQARRQTSPRVAPGRARIQATTTAIKRRRWLIIGPSRVKLAHNRTAKRLKSDEPLGYFPF